MGKRRHGLFSNAADLVHLSQKTFFNQAAPALVPCPPHWISPLWEQEHRSKAKQMPYLRHEARTTQPLAHPCHKTKYLPSQWPKQPGIATQMLCMDHKAVPLPFLHYQSVTKASLPRKHHTANSILTILKSDFRSRVTAVPLTSAKQHLIPSLLDSKHQLESSRDSRCRMEAASGPNLLPRIFADCDHLPEDLTHLSQHPPSSKFLYHQAEFPFMGNRTIKGTGTKAFPKYQAKTTHKPVKSVLSPEALSRPRLQDRVLTTKLSPIGVPSSPRPDHWSKAISFKASDLGHWVQAKTCKVLQSEHGLKKTVSLLRCIDKRSKDPSMLLSNLNGRTRATTACPPCPQHWTTASSKATALPSQGPKHQASITLTPSQDFKPLEASSSCLEDPCAKTTSSPFTEAPLGPDYKAKDTSGLSLLSEHQVAPIIIPVYLDHCRKTAQDSQLDATTLLFPSYQKSTSSGSDVQVTHLQHAPGLGVQTALPLVCHQDTAVIGSQDQQVEVLQDKNPEAPTPKGLDHLAINPVDLDPSTMSPPKSDYKATLPFSYECKVIALCRNEYKTEPAASDPNEPQTILPTDHDNQEPPQLDPDSTQRLTQLNSGRRATYSPSSDDHQTENIQNCHKQLTPQDQLDQRETKPPGPGPQAITLVDQDHEYKLSIDIKAQDKTDQVHWRTPPLDIEQKDTNPPGSDPQIALLPSHVYKGTDVPGPDAPVYAKPEHQEIMPPERDHKGPASIGQAAWKTSPLSITDPKNLMHPGPQHQTTLPASPNPRVIIPHSLDRTPGANAQGILQTEQDVFIFQNEQECEALPLGISHQVMTIEDLSHKAVTLPGLDFQFLPEPEDQTPMLLHADQQSEDALDSNTWVSLQKERHHWQTVPLGTYNRDTTTEVWDHKVIPTLGLNLMDTALPNLDHRATHPLSLDFQVIPPLTTDHQDDLVSEASDEISKVRLERGPQGAIPPEEDHQDTAVPSQDQQAIPSLNIELCEVTLFGLNFQNELQFISDHQSEAVPDPNTQVTPPLDLYHSAKMLVGPRQVIPSSSPKSPFVLLTRLKNKNEAKSDVTDSKGTTPCLDEEEIASPSPIYRAKTPSGPKHPNEAPIACDHHPEAELSSGHPDEVQSSIQHQTFSRKKSQILWRLNYIKPYTIEGGDVPEKIIDDIICSIPQDEIKNDICRQTILQKMKRVSTIHCYYQGIPLDYPVCLICVSWIPNGCPHVWGMKYPCEAQLLVIPVPVSDSEEEINVKFILQVRRATRCSIFSLPYPYYDLQGPLAHPLNSTVSSHSDLVLPVSSMRKWLGFILGKDPQPEGRTLPTSQWPYKGEIAIEKDGGREEATSKERRTFLRSILDMLQKKQRRN
uniref:Uncharacterized protein LOC110208185 n=1 Tax=Phascolarctos cinereus TaxID=38626 RepID=A0A6P5K9R1_PHACI|nr:uncharacterized protein LOC110208185 [Phascolarctos cinereus]